MYLIASSNLPEIFVALTRFIAAAEKTGTLSFGLCCFDVEGLVIFGLAVAIKSKNTKL
jgi:hypothetical protein